LFDDRCHIKFLLSGRLAGGLNYMTKSNECGSFSLDLAKGLNRQETCWNF